VSDPSFDTPTVVATAPSQTASTRSEETAIESPSSARYLIIEEIGRGGMGRVLRAYDPRLQREVALKTVRSGFGTDAARTRMIREARAMAQVSHPNVVAVFDVEEEPSGVLLAMEYVEGVTLRAWLEQAHPWREVVDVFVAAGRGIAAAHRQALLHRDFKPANVLIGADGRIRVTDFGLARAQGADPSFDGDAADRSTTSGTLTEPLTEAGLVLGTPRYMAPEQHQGHALGPATDQFAFCVALWEALVGEPPFRGPDLAKAKLAGPPAWPRSIAVPGPIVRAILRGLAPSPTDRHPSMDALLSALTYDPAGRRRAWGIVLGVIAFAGIGGTVWSSSMHEGAARCQGARAQLDPIWGPQRREHVAAAMTAEPGSYIEETWQRIAPALDRYADAWMQMHTEACEATVVHGEQSAELLDLRMACLRRARDELAATADLLELAELSVMLRARNLVDRLPPLAACADAEGLRTGVPEPDPEDKETVEAMHAAFAESAAAVAAGKYERSTEALVRARALAESIEHPPSFTELELREGITLTSRGDYDGAEAALKRALEGAARWGQWELARNAMFQLVPLLSENQHRPREALGYVELASGLAARKGDAKVNGQWRLVHAAVLRNLGDFEAAERQMRVAITEVTEALGPDHEHVAVARSNLATLLDELGRRAEAEVEHLAALEIWVERLGEDHPNVAAFRHNLAASRAQRGQHAEAEPLLRQALASWIRTFGNDHPHVQMARTTLSICLKFQGRFEEAETLLTETLEVRMRAFGPEHPDVYRTRNALANVTFARGDYARAIEEYRIALDLARKIDSEGEATIGTAHDNLGMALFEAERWEEAEPHFRAGLQIRLERLPPEHPYVGQSKANLGRLLVVQGDPNEALNLLESAWTIAQSEDAPPDLRAEAGFGLAQARWARGDRAAARTVAQLAVENAAEAGPTYAAMQRNLETWLATHPAP
jgi:eukaryotic-like serine/threonine-protein kinase